MRRAVSARRANVLVSALLAERGLPAKLWSACRNGEFRPAYDQFTLSEYQEVLNRPELGLLAPAVADVVGVILRFGVEILTPPLVPGVFGLPDPDDEHFLAVTLMTPDRILVTGNARHYPFGFRRGVAVLSPREALGRLKSD